MKTILQEKVTIHYSITIWFTTQTDAEVQGNLLRQYEQKFAELVEQQKLTKLCSNAVFSKNIEKGTVLHYT